MTNLKNNIMRRVYYVYVLRHLKHPLAVHSAVVAACFVALSEAVSIPDIFSNMLEVKVGELVGFWVGAFSNTGMVTLVLVAVMLVATLSLPWRLKSQEVDEFAF